MGLPKEKLWITIYKDDDEAFEIWHKQEGVPAERIVRMGEKSNFWMMGETGPCGPCSEILYDQGPEDGLRKARLQRRVRMRPPPRDLEPRLHPVRPGRLDGSFTPLPKPNIDTGMGLERLAAVIQGVTSNYDSDLFTGIIRFIEKISGKTYGENPENDISIRVIADHGRAVTFLIGDGVLPSNEGRGYVLRRILRRAARHGKLLGFDRPFLHEVVAVVIDEMKEAYPELVDRAAYIRKVVESEEERFIETLDAGLRILQDEVATLKAVGSAVIPGEVVFKLYDTFGFPVGPDGRHRQEGRAHPRHGGLREGDGGPAREGAGSLEGKRRVADLRDLPAALRQGHQTEFVGYEEVTETTSLRDGHPQEGRRGGRHHRGHQRRDLHRPDALLRRDGRPGGRYGRDRGRGLPLRGLGHPAAPTRTSSPISESSRRGPCA